ncbi:hypothetical protein [Deinococcus sp.]|uniref:hypothetical protein n=1 Tax=Deinococcus sp. TaxID=47478 RepID=UPI0025E20B1A|nr:hypothetical protein [Deinococcus sp.]
MHSSLLEVLSRTRAAVQSRAQSHSKLPELTAPVRPVPVQIRPDPRLMDPPPPRILALFPSFEALIGAVKLSAAERRAYRLLHRLAVDVARERRYEATPHQVVYHCPAVTIAGVLGITDRHLRRLVAGLERAGLLDCGGHAQQIGARSLYDGTLWAVLMIPNTEPPRIRAEDWRHNWRPTFEADVVGKTGAALEMSELLLEHVEPEDKYRAAKARAAVPGASSTPAAPSSDIFGPASLRGVIDGVAALWRLHSSKRPRAVGVLASQIAAALIEPERRRYWCRVLWQALTAQDEGRTGGLSALIGQLDRLVADLVEGAPWRSPGAVLAARLKGAL